MFPIDEWCRINFVLLEQTFYNNSGGDEPQSKRAFTPRNIFSVVDPPPPRPFSLKPPFFFSISIADALMREREKERVRERERERENVVRGERL
jgi:hypothetical protein